MDRRTLVASLLGSPLTAFVGRPTAPTYRAKTLNGESFTNETLKNRPVLIQFWATWCKYCKKDEPAVERIVAEFKDLLVLAVSVNESKAKIRKYLETAPRTPKIVATEDTNLAALFAPRAFPMYVLIDAKGGMVDVQEGAGGYEALKELVNRL